MRRAIVGYHQDVEGHWVADLACGHTQHVRHDPPWQVRVWVTTSEGRASHLGTELDCILCDERGSLTTEVTEVTENDKDNVFSL